MDIERSEDHELYVLRDVVSGLEEEQSIDHVIARQFEKVIDEALQAYQPTISKTETTTCDWCKGVVGEYFDVLWYDFINRKRGSVNYCPNCGRRLEEKNHGSKEDVVTEENEVNENEN